LIKRTLLVTVALLGLGAFTWGCNDDGGGTLTLEEYFEKIDGLDQAQVEQSDAIEAELDALGEDATPDQVADSFQEQVDLLGDFVADLDDIDPPAEVEETHNEAVRALDAAQEEFGELITAFREAETVEEGFAAFDEGDFTEIEKADAACLDLEQIAADNNIEVDLDCGEGEEG